MYQKPICECGALLTYSEHFSLSKSFEIGVRGRIGRMIAKSGVDFEASTLNCTVNDCRKIYEVCRDEKDRVIRGVEIY